MAIQVLAAVKLDRCQLGFKESLPVSGYFVSKLLLACCQLEKIFYIKKCKTEALK